jgi:hypothetical protein
MNVTGEPTFFEASVYEVSDVVDGDKVAVTEFELLLSVLVPAAFVAVTLKVNDTP